MMRFSRFAAIAILALASLVVVAGVAIAGEPDGDGVVPEKRVALVVGNADYRLSPLVTPLNDAGLVAQTLAQAGFDVTAVANADGDKLRKTFQDFVGKVRQAGPDAVVFVYLAGYGVQFDGDNYFAPVDAQIVRDIDVPQEAIRVSDLATPIAEAPARARIFVYDLARVTPFAKTGLPLAGGLLLPPPADGTVIAFNAAPGTVAPADAAPYGAYARALAEMIQSPGLPLDALFERVRWRVSERTDGAVIPWNTGNSNFVFYSSGPAAHESAGSSVAVLPVNAAFASCIGLDTLPAYESFVRAYPRDGLAMRIRWILAARREALVWRDSLRADTPNAYWTYMRRYPRGPHFGDVRRSLAALHVALEPPPRFDLSVYKDLAPPTADELSIVNRSYLIVANPGWSPIPPPPARDLPPPRAAFYQNLPPPPLAPDGALPLPPAVALPFVTNRVALRGQGHVTQPYVAGYGALSAESKGSTVIVSSKDKVVSRSVEMMERGNRTILQTGTGGATLSRTTTTRDMGTVTITQTGPAGDLLTQEVAHTDPNGTRTTTVTDARREVLSTVETNQGGVVTAITPGAAPVREQTLTTPPAPDETRAVTTPIVRGTAASPPPSAPAPAAALEPAPAENTPVARPAPAAQSDMPISATADPAPPNAELKKIAQQRTAPPLPPPRPDFRKAGASPPARKKAADVKKAADGRRTRPTKSGG